MNKYKQQGFGITIGIAIGTALGVATDSLGVWLTLGIVIGLAFGSVGSKQNNELSENKYCTLRIFKRTK